MKINNYYEGRETSEVPMTTVIVIGVLMLVGMWLWDRCPYLLKGAFMGIFILGGAVFLGLLLANWDIVDSLIAGAF